jgi:two-component system chemotaxis response regulator CheB
MSARDIENQHRDPVWYSNANGSWLVELKQGSVFISGYASDGSFQAVSVSDFSKAIECIEELVEKFPELKSDIRVVASSVILGKIRRELAKKEVEVSKSVIRHADFSVKFDSNAGKIQVSQETVNSIAPIGIGAKDHFGGRKMRVLIVDDSDVIGTLLKKVVESDSQMMVVGICPNPLKAESMIEDLKPDLITMDIYMPEIDGVELVRRIYPKYKIPIVMISSVSKEEGPMVLEAMDLGAFDYIQKPSLRPISELSEMIVPRLKAAASSVPPSLIRNDIPPPKVAGSWRSDRVIAIGSSTGGTEALKRLFNAFPDEIPPVVVAQHIPPVFSDALAKRLNSYVKFEVREAKNGDLLARNVVLIAPGGSDMRIVKSPAGLAVEILPPNGQFRHHPCVDFLFESVAEVCQSAAVGVILTGMGSDGALGMKAMKDAGIWNIAQDESSSVVFGMPKEAVAKGGVEDVAHLDDIAARMDIKLKKV